MKLDALGNHEPFQVGNEYRRLPRGCIEHERIGAAKDIQMANRFPLMVRDECLAALASNELLNFIRTEAVQKSRAVGACQFDTASSRNVGNANGRRQGRMF